MNFTDGRVTSVKHLASDVYFFSPFIIPPQPSTAHTVSHTHIHTHKTIEAKNNKTVIRSLRKRLCGQNTLANCESKNNNNNNNNSDSPVRLRYIKANIVNVGMEKKRFCSNGLWL